MLDYTHTQINADDSWKLLENSVNLTGTGQTVCVIDSGVDYNHKNLGGCYGNNDPSSPCKILGGYDTINNDSDPMDDNSPDYHGTHVTGIIISNDSSDSSVASGEHEGLPISFGISSSIKSSPEYSSSITGAGSSAGISSSYGAILTSFSSGGGVSCFSI